MYERRWGRIVGIAMHPNRLSPAYAYNLGKAADPAFLLAHEQAWHGGVTMNVIAPGPVTGIASLEAAVAQCDHGAAWTERKCLAAGYLGGDSFLCFTPVDSCPAAFSLPVQHVGARPPRPYPLY